MPSCADYRKQKRPQVPQRQEIMPQNADTAEVSAIEHPHNHIEEVLERALDIALEKKDPQRMLERRRKREARKAAEETPKVHRPAVPSPAHTP